MRLATLPAVLAVLAALVGCQAAGAPRPRAVDRQTAALIEMVRWPDPSDAVVLSLASRFIAARDDAGGFQFFGERAAAVPGRPLFLALQGMFQARMADQVFLLRRIAWVKSAASRLDQAADRDPLSRVVRGLTLARVPARFHRAEDAAVDLRWALEAGDSPLRSGALPANIAQGLRRASWQALAYAHATAGRPAEARAALARSGASDLADDAPPLVAPYSVSAKDGLRFGPAHVVSYGHDVHVATGYDFADLAFVVTSDGVVAIDAGTTPETAAAALAAFRREVTDAPIRAVIVTHAHWDHIGGLSALAGPGTEVVASARYEEELEHERRVGVHARWFFGEGFRAERALAFRPTRTVSARIPLRFGDTEFELIPVRGGETEDALLVNLPRRGIVFVGDAFMPYLGAPFVAEGSPEGLLETIAVLRSLSPARLVHGHPPLTDFFTAQALPGLADALRDLVGATDTAIRAGRPVASILDDNLLPPSLRAHPEAQMPYLLMRDQLVERMQRQRTGYWQPDREGVEIVSPADRARALALLASGDEHAFMRAAESLLGTADDAMALELVEAGLATFPGSAELRALRSRALDALRARNAQLNPFKFIVYSELRGAELPPVVEPRAAVADARP